MKKFLYLLLATAMLATFGCTGDTNTNAVGVPNPNTLMPTGTVQGILKDVCTNEPIVGAIIDIGVAKATTNERGQYVMKKVPATSYVSPTGERRSGYSGTYSVTIDMRKAESTVTKTKNYPAFSYDEVEVQFSSLEETNGESIANVVDEMNDKKDIGQVASTTNHDTPVVGLGNGDQDFYIGQVTTSISGIAVTPALAPVPNGYTVKIYSLGSHWNGNTSTGAQGHLILTTQTKTINNIQGRFEFTGLEAKQNYKIEVIDTDTDVPTVRGLEWKRTKCDGTTWFGVQDGDPIIVESTDKMCPFITASTPTNYSDLDPATEGGINVTFTFSEPIKKTPQVTDANGNVTASQLDGLYKDIYVVFEGNKAVLNKAGNIAHTIKWNAAMTVLTVNIPVLGKASVYSVSIGAGAVEKLMDAAGHHLAAAAIDYTNDKCPTLSPFYDKHIGETVGSALYHVPVVYQVHFTTYGAAAAGTPVLSLAGTPYDYNSPVGLSWTETAGAKFYNLYCAVNQVWGTTVQAHPYVKINTAPIYGMSGSIPPGTGVNGNWQFVENYSIKLTHTCYVVGVDADGLEGPASNTVTASDTIAPVITGSNLGGPTGAIHEEASVFTVNFREPMVKSEIQNIANWTLNPDAFTGTPPTVTSVVYNQDTFVATVTLSGPLEALNVGSISTGPDGILQTVKVGNDETVISLGNGSSWSACVTSNTTNPGIPAGTDGFLVPGALVVNANDRMVLLAGQRAITGQLIVDSGANGVCETTAVTGTLQTLPVGQGLPNQVAITAAVGETLETTVLLGDDTRTNAPVLFTVTGVHDVSGNAINPNANQILTDGITIQ